ncbi:MAG: nitroreductase [Candidatus Komeilibacteria bacterium CG10_big_fil_rev_8_21_14_0_10_41_13]|uniref:Nitroreductase n=1 Tax=Candidatus Komeilibacteria bacterium CG10_big_fil_rev_8_21_14_0_10_41_13 TaxID=1974476 RepID=A0A2M6WCJ5_9BACT|nr:MAG: nitroreductase [Candidatus Komeilibacteria bacterium CG10_big_fil_rev_8_21_14_0_10_41_13]
MTYPQKPATIKYPVNDLIKNRWSPRFFSDKSVEEEKLMSLFEAARWAASSYNGQPWRFIYALRDDQKNWQKLLSFLNEFNQGWAGSAGALIITFAKEKFDYNNKANYHHLYDTGSACGYLVLEAVNQGLVAHQMAGFDMERAKSELKVPEGYKAASAIAVGYPAGLKQVESSESDFKTGELKDRDRLSLDQIVFKGQWQDQ